MQTMRTPFWYRLRFAVALWAVGCSRGPEPSVAQVSNGQVTRSIDQSRRTAITDAAAKVAPTVVTVQTEVVDQTPQDPFAFFFGGQSQPRAQAGLGTGFVVRSDGVIVTNAHVVAGATKVSVMMRDGTTFPATIKGQDETNDIAVIKIDGKNLPVAKLGNSDDLVIGEWAIAIGNPYGFLLGNSEPSVTAGVISATGRNLVAARDEGSAAYFDMIQTDAAINPGNSGGPLVNANGEIIGVNSSIYSNTGGSIGIGFAIPINRVNRVVDDLLSHGSLRRPWLGIKLRMNQSDNPRDAINAGAAVASVVPNSPAANAGVLVGDIILREGNRTVRNQWDWEAALLDLRVGSAATLHLRRGNREFDAQVNVVDQPEVSAQKVQVLRDLQLITLTPAIRADNNIHTTSGAMVYGITEDVADALGVQKGDVIVQINQRSIKTADDAARAINAAAGRGFVRMLFEHQGRIYITDFAVR